MYTFLYTTRYRPPQAYLMFLIFAYVLLTPTKARECLINKPEPFPKRFPVYNEVPINITIDMSSRLTHQLNTHIFKIFAEEVLGYQRIIINEYEDYFQTESAISRFDENETTIGPPSAIINLEVWIPPETYVESIEDSSFVQVSGNVAPPSRFGWFIPKELKEPVKKYYSCRNNESDKVQEIVWNSLHDSSFVENFDITDRDLLNYIKQNSRTDICFNKNNTLCKGECSSCTKNIYEPDYCKDRTCALLLTSHYSATEFVINDIVELKLLVKVVWLGDNLETVVNKLKTDYLIKQKNKSILILHWAPSKLVLKESDFLTIEFPRCNIPRLIKKYSCRYEMNRMLKFSWSKLEKSENNLYLALSKFKFNEQEYSELLDLYAMKSSSPIYDIACEWMQKNEFIWNTWKQNPAKTKIYIGGIFPMSASAYRGRGILSAANLAKQAVNKNATILPGYELHLIVHDGRCKADNVMKAFIEFITEAYYQNLVGVLGPACSDTVEPIAGVSKHYKTLIISYSAEGSSFSDREKYPYFFRTIGENKHYKHVYLEFFQRMRWKRIAALTEDGQKYTEYISIMQEFLEANQVTFISNTKFPRDRKAVAMTYYLEDLKKKMARIIIADIYDEIARSVMCEAYKLQMTPAHGYVWFLPIWLNTTWYDTDFYNKIGQEGVNCTTVEMIKAITGYFTLAHAYFANDSQIMQENITVGEWRKKYEAYIKQTRRESSDYAGFAYDAVWTYALALKKLNEEDPEALSNIHSDNITNKLVEIVENTDFYGVSGRIKFRGGPSRFSVINILEWYNNETHKIGHFFPNLTDNSPEVFGGELVLNSSAIKWFTLNGEIPDDGTPSPQTCAIDSVAKLLNVTCEFAVVIVNLIVAVILVAIVLVLVFYFKKQYDEKMRVHKRYMKSIGIDLDTQKLITDLDKWEIQRVCVVINRKLGEGAFGTVYGGEADLPNRGWVAVAVKTLKIGSTIEEKLDFLSEAEVMKRFEHKNIVKLLGVCTKEEPVYTIMEFMLYGDLKTFLLARRNLVKDNVSEESEEISSTKLTGMALDIARALSYLESIKYVHRDVASRNCLIDEHRVIKLGDFGMTRMMFENDYYKFNRRGMLPVRWMAPESLTLGIFTPASDVWSYGVLLYEIITFGSFPYQGLSNTQVLEQVKRGKTLTIPKGVKPLLEALIRSCWNQDNKVRPSAKEIVELLADNPRLIEPCLDGPISSIQIEHTGQLEMHLSDQFRKCSTSGTNLKHSSSIPNGLSETSFSRNITTLRRDSVSDIGLEAGVSIPLEICGPKEPLLGHAKSNSSLLNFGKFGMQHNRTDSGRQDEEASYMNNKNHGSPNGRVVTKV